MPRLRMRRAVPPLPQYVFMTYLIKRRNNLTFTTFTSRDFVFWDILEHWCESQLLCSWLFFCCAPLNAAASVCVYELNEQCQHENLLLNLELLLLLLLSFSSSSLSFFISFSFLSCHVLRISPPSSPYLNLFLTFSFLFSFYSDSSSFVFFYFFLFVSYPFSSFWYDNNHWNASA
jgi:hypothetical protein